jgi:hypothetical protein
MARSATLSGTVNWSDGTPFNGWALLLLVPPDGYSQMFLADIWPRVRLPLRLAVPITNGAFNQNCKVWYNADLEPPNSKWVIYWLDYTGTTIASPASMSDAFTVSTETHNVTPPTLTAPTAEASLPPADWDPTPVALANFFTGNVNAGGYDITNVGDMECLRIICSGSVVTKSVNPELLTFGAGFIDYDEANNETRLVSKGPTSSINGAFRILTNRLDGSGGRTSMSIDVSGNITLIVPSGASISFSGLGTYADNAAAASGGVPVGGLYIASSGDPRPICVRV